MFGGLSFLAPAFLIGALAVAVPIVLHLFRRRTEEVVDFPAMRLLRKAPVERQSRRRLRELLLLALRTGALLLLAFAFARPYFAGGASAMSAPVTVVAVDTSMSLSAPGQFARVRAAAREAIDQAPTGALVAVMAFDDRVRVLAPAGSDRAAARATLEALQPGPGGTRYRTVLGRAADLIGPEGGEIVVVTDLQQSGWDAPDDGGVPDGIAVRPVAIAPPEGNLAITAAERTSSGITALVHNYGEGTRRAEVRLLVDGREAGRQAVSIAPLASGEARFAMAVPVRGVAELRVDDGVGYAADDARYLLLDPPPAVPLLVLTSDPPASSPSGLYLERALGVAGNGTSFAVDVLDGVAFSALDAAAVTARAAILVVGTRTLDRRGRERLAGYLAQGGQVLLALGPDLDVPTLADALGTDIGVEPEPVDGPGATALVPTDRRHPIFRPFNAATGGIGDLVVAQVRRLRSEDDWQVLARFAGGPAALAERAVGQGRLLVFASDLDNRWNRFPLQPSFVPFVIEAARYLSRGRETPLSWTLPDVPEGAQPQPGMQTLPAADGSAARRIVVNVDTRESNPAATTVEAFANGVVRTGLAGRQRVEGEAREREDRQRLWQMGLGVMLLALAVESLLGRRAT